MEETNTSLEMFLKYEYAETRDLMKAFLTVVSGTLALSLAFLDKIVRTHLSDGTVRKCMIGSWVLLFLALCLGGASIILISAAAGCMIYQGIPFFGCGATPYALWSWGRGLWAALLFGLGLVSMAIAAWRSLELEALRTDPEKAARSKNESGRKSILGCRS